MLFIYGTRRVNIDIGEITMRCPICDGHTPTDIMVSSSYFHIFWVPIAPIGKEAHVACNKCGKTRSGLPFDSDLFSNYKEIKSKFRHPLYAYIGVGLFAALVLLIIISRLTATNNS